MINENLENKLKYFGKGAIVYPWAKIICPEKVELGDWSEIDDFVFMFAGGDGIKIKRFVHIASYVSIIGHGGAEFEDHSCAAAGARLITSANVLDSYHGSGRSPKEQQSVTKGRIYLEKDAFLATNSVVFPGVRIGEGAVLGAGAVATKDLEPWGIYFGQPAKFKRMRKKVPLEWY